MVSNEFKNNLRKHLSSTKIDCLSIYTDGVTVSSLDNDDYWNEDDCEYDRNKMLQKLEENFCGVFESCGVSDCDNDHQKEKLYIVYKNLLEFKREYPEEKFMVFLGTTYSWRIGIDSCVHMDPDMIENILRKNKYITAYLIVCSRFL